MVWVLPVPGGPSTTTPRVAAQPAEDPALRRADGQREERVDDGRLVVPGAGEPGGAVGGLDRLDELGEADRQRAFRVGQVGDDRVVERAQRRGPAPAGDERGGGHERGAGPGRGDPVVAAGVLDPQVPVRPPGEDGDEVGVQRRGGGDVLAGRGVVDEPRAGQQLLVLPARGLARERHDHLVAVVLDAHRAGEQVDPDVLVGRVQQAAGQDELDGLGLVRGRAHEVEQRVERRPHRALGGGAQDLVAGLGGPPDRALVGHVDEGELAHVVTGVADGAGAGEGHPSQHLDQALDPVAQGGVVLGTGDIGRSARDPERFLRHGHDLAPSARVLGPPADHNRIPVQVRAREPVRRAAELEGTARAPRAVEPRDRPERRTPWERRRHVTRTTPRRSHGSSPASRPWTPGRSDGTPRCCGCGTDGRGRWRPVRTSPCWTRRTRCTSTAGVPATSPRSCAGGSPRGGSCSPSTCSARPRRGDPAATRPPTPTSPTWAPGWTRAAGARHAAGRAVEHGAGCRPRRRPARGAWRWSG